MVKNIQKNLTNIVVIIGLISSIGVGFSKFAKMEEQVKVLREASYGVDVASIEAVKENSENVSTNTLTLNNHQTAIAILKKEIQLLNLQINEIKISNSNPLQ